MRRRTSSLSVLAARLTNEGARQAEARILDLSLNTRDETTGVASATPFQLPAGRAAIVVVDIWTRHPCPGATAWPARMIAAWNRFLDAARVAGISVIFASSGDDLKRWEGSPHRIGITGLPHHPLPDSNGFLDNHGDHGPWASLCMCPITRLVPGTNEPHFDCKTQNHDPTQDRNVLVRPPDLFIAAGHYHPPDLPSAITSWGQPAQQELWNFCREKGRTHLLYIGDATNLCVINREFGMIQMRRLGLQPILVRDLTNAMTYVGYNPETQQLDPSITPAAGTAKAVEYIERKIGPSIDSGQIFAAAARYGYAPPYHPVVPERG